MKNRHLRTSHNEVYFLTALLVVAVVVVPLTSWAIFRSQDDDGEKSEKLGDFRPVVLEHRRDWRVQRRLYANAVDRCSRDITLADTDTFCSVYWELVTVCLEERRFGVNYGCPDINNPRLWEAFRDELNVDPGKVAKITGDAAPHAAAPQEPSLTENDLQVHEKALLRRYRRARVCPESLRQYLPGFYELCVSLVGGDSAPESRTGMLNDLATVKMRSAAPEPTMKLRQAQWAEFGRPRPDR